MTQTERKQKGRSPRYPGIPLDLAIERAQQLWDHEAHYATNVQTALSHWGYAPKSGGGAVAVAALKAYGLISDAGSGDTRTVQLTTRAQDILLSDDPVKARAAIEEAAISPTAHKDLWDRYGPQLPSDQSLKLYLMNERGFTPSGATEMISVYKRTIDFAGLTGRGGTVSRDEPEAIEDAPVVVTSGRTVSGSLAGKTITGGSVMAYGGGTLQGQVDIPIPLIGGGTARFSFPRPISQTAWDQMISVLNALKPAVLAVEDDPEPSLD